MKNEKGITLIALIITIIVMLILVAVTVNVAINGGLFKEADDAATGTEEAAIYDQIVSAMVLTDNGKINVTETANAAIADLQAKNYTVTSEGTSEVILTVTGKKGTYKYTITEKEIKELKSDDQLDDETYSAYTFKDLASVDVDTYFTRDENFYYIFFENKNSDVISLISVYGHKKGLDVMYLIDPVDNANEFSEYKYDYDFEDNEWRRSVYSETLGEPEETRGVDAPILTDVKILTIDEIVEKGIDDLFYESFGVEVESQLLTTTQINQLLQKQ